jgi:methionine--tRNA ligase beta chain
MLGLEHSARTNRIPDSFELLLPAGQPLGEPALLFKTISEEEVAALRARFAGTQDEAAANASPAAELAFPADLRVGQIAAVAEHPESADRLWVLTVDLGAETRQIVAGVREHYPTAAELVGRKVVVVCNLKPVSLKGQQSEGMMLAAMRKEAFGLLCAPAGAAPGARVFAGELRNAGEEVRARARARASAAARHACVRTPPARLAARARRGLGSARVALARALLSRARRTHLMVLTASALQWGSQWNIWCQMPTAHAYPGRAGLHVPRLALTQCETRAWADERPVPPRWILHVARPLRAGLTRPFRATAPPICSRARASWAAPASSTRHSI